MKQYIIYDIIKEAIPFVFLIITTLILIYLKGR